MGRVSEEAKENHRQQEKVRRAAAREREKKSKEQIVVPFFVTTMPIRIPKAKNTLRARDATWNGSDGNMNVPLTVVITGLSQCTCRNGLRKHKIAPSCPPWPVDTHCYCSHGVEAM